MPQPSSRTVITTLPAPPVVPVSVATPIQIVRPGSLYLIALSTRLINACSKSGALTSAVIDSSQVTSSRMERSSARGRQSTVTAESRSAIRTDSLGRLPVPSLCSMRERANKSSMIDASLSACRAMIWRNRRASIGSSLAPSRRVSTKPLIDAIGVFSSCDTLATKSRRMFSSR